MPNYRAGSEWNDENEIRCLIIYKKLKKERFPRGRQIELCREMAKKVNLSEGNISAKVSNYKSIAGINGHSNASSNTQYFFEKYGHLEIGELQKLLKGERAQ